MVMATGSVCPQYAACEQSHEGGDASEQARDAALALHERLVAYVHALGGAAPRAGVAVEHSYARARSPAAPAVRVLPAPRALPPAAPLDVERLEPPPPEPPAELLDLRDTHDDDDDFALDWEERVRNAATTDAQARLAERAVETLRRLRLARLAACTRHERAHAMRVAARRLRLAAASVAGSSAWLRSTLEAVLPVSARRLLAPRRESPGAGAVVGGGARGEGPVLVWVGSGRARLDARWAGRLGALLEVRALGVGAAAAAPEPWCAAAAGSVRAALLDALADAGERGVIVGGVMAGASLAAALLSGAGGLAALGGGGRVCGALLLAPALLTAEGAADTVRALPVPALLVLGARSAAAPRGLARALARPPRRLLEVRQADELLRVPARAARRLPQSALDAAVAEECARWAMEVFEGGDTDSELQEPEEYAHLPLGGSAEGAGRVQVSRGCGGTPLALLPPRRRDPPAPAPPPPPAPAPPPPPPAPAPLAAADIMRLPIVFADDVQPSAEPSPVTVTAGVGRGRGRARGGRAAAGSTDPYSRVIVASRARPVLLRRTPRPQLR